MNATFDIRLTEDEYNALSVISDIVCEDIGSLCKSCPLDIPEDSHMCLRSYARRIKHLYDNREE